MLVEYYIKQIDRKAKCGNSPNKIVMKSGKTPLNTLKYNVKYDYKEVLTPYGICSLKIWLFYKN